MDPKRSFEFRELLEEFIREIPNQDATGLIDKVEKIERWIEGYVDQSVLNAVAPYVKLKTGKK